jgi:hypothetical protein
VTERRRNLSRDFERRPPGRAASLVTALGMLVILAALWLARGSCGAGSAGFFDSLVRPPAATAAPGASGAPRSAGGDGTIRLAPPAATASGAPPAAASGAPAAPSSPGAPTSALATASPGAAH